MNALKKALFIIALVSVTAYTVRHIEHKWFEQHSSVLDKYNNELSTKIMTIESLDHLVGLYDEAKKKVEAYEADKSNPEISYNYRNSKEPYKSESELEDAIKDWESKSNEIYQLRFYWIVGL